MFSRCFTLIFICLLSQARAQSTGADTVIVPLAETSKIIFTIEDRDDLTTLRHYDFQELFDDILDRLDTSRVGEQAHKAHTDSAEFEEKRPGTQRRSRDRIGSTRHLFNVDVGLNNYLADGQFPTGEPYTVRPWGSWYIAGNSIYRTRLGRTSYIELGVGVSWYTFKFQEDNTVLSEMDDALLFVEDTRDVHFVKSKLGATFVNASLVPVLDISSGEKGKGFRLGLGPYVGYRISSKTKLVYEEDDKRRREKNHDDFYLNSLRYGLRLQVGVRSTDFFINYDLNELFAEGQGPKLNAVSFGFTF